MKGSVCTKCVGGTQGSFPVLFASNFGRPYLSRPKSILGVIILHGKPIESILFPCACERQWVSTTFLKIYVLHQVCRLFGCVDVNSQVLT